MRNSSLVEWFCAENVTGLKLYTEATGCIVLRHDAAVGERSVVGRSASASTRGRNRSANAGISSVKWGEKPHRRKSKVSWALFIISGLVGT